MRVMLIAKNGRYREYLRELVRPHPRFAFAGVFDTVDEAWPHLQRISPEPVVLDVEALAPHGLGVLQTMQSKKCPSALMMFLVRDGGFGIEANLAAGADLVFDGHQALGRAADALLRLERIAPRRRSTRQLRPPVRELTTKSSEDSRCFAEPANSMAPGVPLADP